ncbi:hypothetical protein [Glycomyces tenuis]|uniref:hypothetical protein n=1 Tax=Glycomyces tenuis TaxID=58116 RepID=UPI000413B669|nr:hypothetical protein [Glycomyces tenuis]
MSEPVGVTPQQLSDAEQQLRSQIDPAAELETKANAEGLDMMAWGVPGLFFSPGYYQMTADIKELFRMMVEGLEGHATRLKDCREAWDTADMDTATEFSQFAPEGLGSSIDWGGATFTGSGGNYTTAGPVAVIDGGSWMKASPTKAITNYAEYGDKIEAVKRADDGGEMLYAVMDISAATMGWAGDAMEIATNPLSFLISAGLDFLISLIQPVDDLLGMVIGNAERMGEEIKRWNGIKGGLPPIGEAVATIPEGGLSQWSGQDGNAARTKIKEFAEAVLDLGDKIQVLEGLMQLCELIATLIRKTLLGILADWITNQIIAWAIAGAASAFTFGGAAAAQLANSIRSAIQTVIKALDRYNKAAQAFIDGSKILSRVQQVVEVAAHPLTEAGMKFVGTVGTLAGAGGPPTSDSIADGFNG